MKNKIYFLSIITLLSVVLSTLAPLTVFAQTIEETKTINNLKAKAASDCASLNSSLLNFKNGFDAATADFGNIKVNQTILNVLGVDRTLPALEATMLAQANTSIGAAGAPFDLPDWCAAMVNHVPADGVLAVQATYDRLKNELMIRELVLPVFNKMRSVDMVYGKFKRLGADYKLIKDFNSDADFTAILALDGNPVGEPNFIREKSAIGGAITAMETVIPEIVKNALATDPGMPVLAFYDDMLPPLPVGKTLASAQADFRNLETKISRNTQRIDLVADEISKAKTAMRSVMTKAAMDGVAAGAATKPAEYADILASYTASATRLATNLENKLTRLVDILTGYQAGVLAAADTTLSPLAALVKANLQARVTALIAAITAINAAVTPGVTSYSNVLVQVDALKNLKIEDTHIPNINSAVNLSKDVTKANDINVVRTRFNNSVAELNPLLDVGDADVSLDDQEDLTRTQTAINALALAPLLGVGADKAAVEQKIRDVANLVVGASYKDVVNLHSVYKSKLSQVAKDFTKLRRDWWALIKVGAIEKQVNLAAVPNLAAEEKAFRVIEDYNTRRQTFVDRAAAIVESRIEVIQNLQFSIQGLLNIPSVAPTDVKGAIDFATESAAKVTELNNELTAIRATENYNDLVTAVKNIKNLGVNNVFIPLQRMYIRFDIHYKKQVALKQLRDLVNGEIGTLPPATPAAIIASLNATSLAINTDLTDALADMNEALADFAAAFPGDMKEVLDTDDAGADLGTDINVAAVQVLKETESGIKARLSSIRSRISDLWSQIKSAK